MGTVVRTLRIRMLVFVFQRQINRSKPICAMVLCVVDHVKFCSRYLIFNFQSFPLMFLKLRCRFRFTICFRCSHFSVIIFDIPPSFIVTVWPGLSSFPTSSFSSEYHVCRSDIWVFHWAIKGYSDICLQFYTKLYI